MTAGTLIDMPARAQAPASNAPVWERIWDHEPAVEADDILLERERTSPRWSLIVDRLEATFGSVAGLKTIELGSGRGDLSVLLARRGAEVTLLDTSEKGLDQARRRFKRLGCRAMYVHADMFQHTDALKNRFDVSLSSGVIEHFRGDQRTAAVASHLDVLKSGGLAVISVPHAWCVPYRLWKSYLEIRGWWPYGPEMPYGSRELRRRAARAGFSRIQTRCQGFWHSVGAHWARNLFHWNVDWTNRPSLVDSIMGFTLLLFAWNDACPKAENARLPGVR